MDYFNIYSIPDEILSLNGYNINILIGENGSGKSTLLNNIRKYYINNRNEKVIAIANTVFDKFTKDKSAKHKVLRASQGRSLIKNTIFNAFKILANNNDKRLYNIAKILEYIEFSPEIGIRVRGIENNFREKLIDSSLPEEQKEDMLYFLNRFNEYDILSHTIRINLYKNDFDDIVNSSLIQIFLYEKKLKELDLIKDVELFLFKGNYTIPINQASSGELSIISTLIYIATIIDSETVILIDEPENSLHPKWQVEYIERLLDIFYYYEPKVVIATHSLLIIDGTENISNSVNIFKSLNGQFRLCNHDISRNIEETYQKYFDITTPENRYISDFIVRKMNLLAEKEISFGNFKETIDKIIYNSYDEKQKAALNKLINIGYKISENHRYEQ